MKRFFFACLAVPAVFSAAWAYEVFEPVQDSYTTYWYYQGDVSGIDDNYGDSSELSVDYYMDVSEDVYGAENTYIQFNLSTITPGTHIIRATLRLYVRGWLLPVALMNDLTEEWIEMEITSSNAPYWGDYITSLSLYGIHPPEYYSVELPVEYVEDWIDYPSQNFGFVLYTNYSMTYITFSSRETDNPPLLEVWLESDDTEPPACSESYPTDGEDGVPPDSQIEFTLTDDLAGVDTDTIGFTLEAGEDPPSGNRAFVSVGSRSNTPIEGTLDIDDEDPLEVLCTFTPDEPLPWAAYTCTVDGSLADLLGNQMGEDYVWTFSTYGYDEDPPEVTDTVPGDGEDDVPPDSTINFHLTDAYAGVDVSTLTFTARGDSRQPASLNRAKAISPSPSRSGDIEGELEVDPSDLSDVVCTFTPSDDLPPGPITCTVAGSLADRDGNALGDDFTWTFSVGGSLEYGASWGEIKAAF
jgi:hypothetical protein